MYQFLLWFVLINLLCYCNKVFEENNYLGVVVTFERTCQSLFVLLLAYWICFFCFFHFVSFNTIFIRKVLEEWWFRNIQEQSNLVSDSWKWYKIPIYWILQNDNDCVEWEDVYSTTKDGSSIQNKSSFGMYVHRFLFLFI